MNAIYVYLIYRDVNARRTIAKWDENENSFKRIVGWFPTMIPTTTRVAVANTLRIGVLVTVASERELAADPGMILVTAELSRLKGTPKLIAKKKNPMPVYSRNSINTQRLRNTRKNQRSLRNELKRFPKILESATHLPILEILRKAKKLLPSNL